MHRPAFGEGESIRGWDMLRDERCIVFNDTRICIESLRVAAEPRPPRSTSHFNTFGSLGHTCND